MILMGCDTPKDGFKLEIEDVFAIKGHGIVVVGVISSGEVRTGDTVYIVDSDNNLIAESTVFGIEKFHEVLDKAGVGEAVGIGLSNVDSYELSSGYYLTSEKPV